MLHAAVPKVNLGLSRENAELAVAVLRRIHTTRVSAETRHFALTSS